MSFTAFFQFNQHSEVHLQGSTLYQKKNNFATVSMNYPQKECFF